MIRWKSSETLDGTGPIERRCPTCGAVAPMRPVLSAPGADARGNREFTLWACSACGAAHFDPTPDQDYAHPVAPPEAARAFYLQQGAGLWSMASAILRLPAAKGARRLVEIGCGFGFGLDMARRALGYSVQGYDPSPMALVGREAFDLPIEVAYADLAAIGSADVIVCSELIEHLPEPAEFAAALRRALGDCGTLIISTPNFDACRPDTPPGLLTPLLSLGHHITLQTADSLKRMLATAGFDRIEVEVRGANLLALAGVGPARWSTEGPETRAAYRRWLDEAAATQPVGGDLWLGLATRAFREAMAAGDATEAASWENAIAAACADRFGRPPTAWTADELAVPMSLEDLTQSQPLALAALLLMAGHRRIIAGEAPGSLVPLLDAAAAAARRLRMALARLGTDDADAEDIEWQAGAEAAMRTAMAGGAGVIERLRRLGVAPGDGLGGRDRRAELHRRCLVALVNAQAFDNAKELLRAFPDAGRPGAQDGPASDTSFALLMLRSHEGESEALARDLAAFAAAARSARRTDLARVSGDAAVLAAWTLGRAADPAALDSLLTEPGRPGDERRIRMLVAAVNRRLYDTARELAARLTGIEAAVAEASPSDSTIEAAFALAMLEANDPEGSATKAHDLIRAVRRACQRTLRARGPAGAAGRLFWPSAEAEVLLAPRDQPDEGGSSLARELAEDEAVLPPKPALSTELKAALENR